MPQEAVPSLDAPTKRPPPPTHTHTLAELSMQHTHLLQGCEEGSCAEPFIQVGSKVLAHHVACIGCLPPGLHGPHMRHWHLLQRLPAAA